MKKILCFALVALTLFSCNKEIETVDGVENNQTVQHKPVTLKYAFNVADKPSFEDGTRAVKDSWVAGDKILIVYDDQLPESLEDFTILEYKSSGWEVIQESAKGPDMTDYMGTLDAIYYDCPDLSHAHIGTGNYTDRFYIDYDVNAERHMYMVDNNVGYIIMEDGTLTTVKTDGSLAPRPLSLDFEQNTVRTYLQIRITDLPENETGWGLWSRDPLASSENEFALYIPIWQQLNRRFTYESLSGPSFIYYFDSREDGDYIYVSYYQSAPKITFMLYNLDTKEWYYKTFTKTLPKHKAAITFSGPQLDADGIPTNGWIKFAKPQDNYRTYVDMGTDVMWATMNLGAARPEETGDYFAWGEVNTKKVYNYGTYKFNTGSGWKTYNKYTYADGTTDGAWYDSDGNFIGDNKRVLDIEDDAARYNWGGNWRLPTPEEWQNLIDNCTKEWKTDYNGRGTNGWLLTASNGNSIFLPAAGYYNINRLGYVGSKGLYWTNSNESSSVTTQVKDASLLSLDDSGLRMSIHERSLGLSIRPVRSD